MMMQSEGAGEGTPPDQQEYYHRLNRYSFAVIERPAESEYIATYYNTLPHIVALRAKGTDPEMPELETCFTALYGYLLLKVQQKEIVGDPSVGRPDNQAVEVALGEI